MDYLIRVFKDKSFLGDSIERLPDDIKVLREKYQINGRLWGDFFLVIYGLIFWATCYRFLSVSNYNF